MPKPNKRTYFASGFGFIEYEVVEFAPKACHRIVGTSTSSTKIGCCMGSRNISFDSEF